VASTEDEGNVNESDDDDDDDIPLSVVQMTIDLFGCEYKEMCKILKMTNWDLSAVYTPDDYDDDDIDNESEANEDSENIISVADYTDFLCKAKQFAKHQERHHFWVR